MTDYEKLYVTFDEDTKMWTVLAAWGAPAIPGLPSKELALAITEALYEAWKCGVGDRDSFK